MRTPWAEVCASVQGVSRFCVAGRRRDHGRDRRGCAGQHRGRAVQEHWVNGCRSRNRTLSHSCHWDIISCIAGPFFPGFFLRIPNSFCRRRGHPTGTLVVDILARWGRGCPQRRQGRPGEVIVRGGPKTNSFRHVVSAGKTSQRPPPSSDRRTSPEV